jgi:multidrug resistance efflux pump
MQRSMLRLSDAMSARPVAGLVFALSICTLLVLVYLQGARTLRVQAVVHAQAVEVRSLLPSLVTEKQVAVGDTVVAGQVLLTLDARGTRRALELVERELATLQAQLDLQSAQLRSQGQRDAFGTLASRLDVERTLRVSRARSGGLRQSVEAAQAWRDNVRQLVEQGAEPRSALLEAEQAVADARARRREAQTLASASQEQSSALDAAGSTPVEDVLARQEALTRASIELLTRRRDHLKADLDRASVVAPSAGRVAQIAPVGAGTTGLLPLARIVPASSRELVAYLPATQDQRLLPKAGQAVDLGVACAEDGTVARVGAVVEAAPEQVTGLLPTVPLFGMPIFVTLPDACPMAPGFVLTVEVLP